MNGIDEKINTSILFGAQLLSATPASRPPKHSPLARLALLCEAADRGELPADEFASAVDRLYAT